MEPNYILIDADVQEILNNPIDESLIADSSKTYFEQVKEQLICQICSNLLDNPKMCSKCEMTFCSKCIDEWLKKKKECPTRCVNSKFKEITVSLRRFIECLKLKCKFGCEVSLISYKQHMVACIQENKKTNCWNCGQACKASDLKVKEELEYNDLKKKMKC